MQSLHARNACAKAKLTNGMKKVFGRKEEKKQERR